MDEPTANEVIMQARAHWFADGDASGGTPGEASGGAAHAPGDAVEHAQEAGHD